MISAFSTGFFLGLSLIVAIGAQNAFVFRQGLIKQHNFYVALFCSISDCLLIVIGIAGISYFFNNFINQHSKIVYGISALWLLSYGIIKVYSAAKTDKKFIENSLKFHSLSSAISTAAIFTFANPHVYLDTIILIGSISQQFIFLERIYFAIGACLASFCWFFGLTYGAQILSPLIHKPIHWRALDLLIALIMFIIAFNLLSISDKL